MALRQLLGDFTSGEYLYQPDPNDTIITLNNSSNNPKQTAPAQVNLNAVAYYSYIGMKPVEIAILVGICRETIWSNSQIRKAYEEGRAHHQVKLRSDMLNKAKHNPIAADILLNRSAGKAEDDAAQGIAPENRKTSDIEVKLIVEERSTDPKIKEIEDTLNDILNKDDE